MSFLRCYSQFCIKQSQKNSHLINSNMLPKFKPFSTTTKTTKSAKLNWRHKIQQKNIVQQVSTILLQRHNWAPLLNSLNIPKNLTPSLFLQILQKTQTNPQTCLTFFKWTISQNPEFQPNLQTQIHITKILLNSTNLTQHAKPILENLVKTYPVSLIVHGILQDRDFTLFNAVLECYSDKGLYKEGIFVFNAVKALGCSAEVKTCNRLLEVLCRDSEDVRLVWCFFGGVVRNGVVPDRCMWSLVGQVLCKEGKFSRVERLLEVGVVSSVLYNLVVEFYSKRGDFGCAFDRLSEMCDKGVDPGFGSYSSVLDGACKVGNGEVVERVMGVMVERGMVSECDLFIQQLCNLGKTYAAEMFYGRACDEKRVLDDATYGCMLRALSMEGRLDEAIRMHNVIAEKSIRVKDNSYYAFANVLCREDPRKEVSEMLRDMISRGFSPDAAELSRYMNLLCKKRRWHEAEQLLNQVLEKRSLPDNLCCCALVKHYCSKRRIEAAVALHDKMETLNIYLDTTTYSLLLSQLFEAGKVDEALRVFDYMRSHDLMDSASFAVMVQGLCKVKQLRKAMKLHDEMLERGLKPEKKIYKRLISGFA